MLFGNRISFKFGCANFCTAIPRKFRQPGWWREYEAKFSSHVWSLYKNTPAGQSTKRGLIIEQAVREEYQRIIGPTADPPNTNSSKIHGSYAFLDIMNNRKIEVRSGIVQYRKQPQGYYLTFGNIRPQESDKILLAGFFPDLVRIWEWNGSTHLHRSGYRTAILGHRIAFRVKSWTMLKDIKAGVIFSDLPVERIIPFCESTEREKMYHGVPFSLFTPPSLGKVTEDIAKEVYEMNFGNVLPPSSWKYDFHDGSSNKRIEVKASSISHKQGYSYFCFKNIKTTMFDVLLLVFYFPDRFEIWKWDKSTSGKLMRGNREDVDGKRLFFSCKENLTLNKCPGELLARLYFDVK